MDSGTWQRRRERHTHRAQCTTCRKLVLAHTNGNGDFVFLELDGPPWEVHGCYESTRLPSIEKPKQDRSPFVGSVVKNGDEVIITGVVRVIEERKLLVRLKNLSPAVRGSATRVLRGRATEIVLRVSDVLEFCICGDMKNIILGKGQRARATVQPMRVPGLGDTFLLSEIEVVPPDK
jgi:hypothetical protein